MQHSTPKVDAARTHAAPTNLFVQPHQKTDHLNPSHAQQHCYYLLLTHCLLALTRRNLSTPSSYNPLNNQRSSATVAASTLHHHHKPNSPISPVVYFTPQLLQDLDIVSRTHQSHACTRTRGARKHTLQQASQATSNLSSLLPIQVRNKCGRKEDEQALGCVDKCHMIRYQSGGQCARHTTGPEPTKHKGKWTTSRPPDPSDTEHTIHTFLKAHA